jgi:flavin reductase (DIM6/NTAB) family NADH-FMN oxidoreductase RutF
MKRLMMRTIDPSKIATKDLHQYLLGTVSPRPIAFVSTLGPDGVPNLAPYSFFNAFSSNPPTVVFSSNRRVADNTTKDTLHNIESSGECVINAVSYGIVRQMAVASVEYPAGVDEFVKAGLTPVPSEVVAPPRVAESPAHLECRVRDIVTLGQHGGAGHLIICDVVRMHISEDVFDTDRPDRINPHKMDLMGRMGRAYYVRASGEAIHTIVQAVKPEAIGFDGLPDYVRSSHILSANNLGQLAGMTAWPDQKLAEELAETDSEILSLSEDPDRSRKLEMSAKDVLDRHDDRQRAALLLMVANQ